MDRHHRRVIGAKLQTMFCLILVDASAFLPRDMCPENPYPPNVGGVKISPREFREWAPKSTIKRVFFEDSPPKFGAWMSPPNLGDMGFQGVLELIRSSLTLPWGISLNLGVRALETTVNFALCQLYSASSVKTSLIAFREVFCRTS